MSNRHLPRIVQPFEYGQRKGTVRVTLPHSDFTRFAGLVVSGQPVEVDLAFDTDANGRVMVRGCVRCEVELECERCLETVGRVLETRVDARIVRSELEAEALRSDAETSESDVIVLDSDAVPLVDLVEDDLILGVPMHACTDFEGCPNRPRLVWGEDDETRERDPAPGPFAALAGLRTGDGSDPD